MLGGSFNPLHIGHAMLADSVVCDLGFDKVLFVPAFIPPHKIMNKSVSDVQRFEMVKAFCDGAKKDGNDHFEAEDCEIVRKGISYTSDTLEFLSTKYRKELDGQKLCFIMGEEVASQFYKWHEPEKVASYADFLIARRHPDNNGIDTEGFGNKTYGDYEKDYSDDSYLKNFPYKHTFLENPVFPVSSTEVRSRIHSGKAFRYLVPREVFSYIVEKKLYGFKMTRQEISKLVAKIDSYAKAHVSESRYAHSVRTALTAQRMCRIYGLDPEMGYLAGIAHDICKSMNDQKMLALCEAGCEPVTDIEKSKPALLHGKAGAVLLAKKFKVTDKDLIEAVANHTFGKPGMCELAKILFIADKVEPGRDHVTESYLEELFSMSLNESLKAVLSESFSYLKSKGKSPAPISLELFESL